MLPLSQVKLSRLGYWLGPARGLSNVLACHSGDGARQAEHEARAVHLHYAGALGEVMAQLRGLGFASSDAQDAVAITIAEGGRPNLEAALDWLCLHVSDTRLPAKFAAGEGSFSTTDSRHDSDQCTAPMADRSRYTMCA